MCESFVNFKKEITDAICYLLRLCDFLKVKGTSNKSKEILRFKGYLGRTLKDKNGADKLVFLWVEDMDGNFLCQKNEINKCYFIDFLRKKHAEKAIPYEELDNFCKQLSSEKF